MDAEQLTQRVEIGCLGTPPVRQIERGFGVSKVEVDGPVVRCLVIGSFPPLLESLRGVEVTTLQSTPASGPASSPRTEGDL